MASLVAGAAAALPSFRGRRALAALPGQGAAMLAVRRDGTGRVLAVAVEKLPSWVVKATGAQSDEPTDDSTEFELVRQLKEEKEKERRPPFIVPHSDEDFLPKADQDTLAGYADTSFELWAGVASRLRPPTDSAVYQGLKLCGETIVSIARRCDKGSATWKGVSDLVEALDLLRRLTSSTLKAPLPQDWWLRWEASSPLEYNDAEMGLMSTLERTFVLVDRDLEFMFQDGN